jgi:hypothetical protein
VSHTTVRRKRGETAASYGTLFHKPDRVEASGRKARGRKPGSGGKHQSPGAHRALPGQERNQAIGVLTRHLVRDPSGFLSDIAAIMLNETVRLGRVSEYKRRETLEKIGRALQLPMNGHAIDNGGITIGTVNDDGCPGYRNC